MIRSKQILYFLQLGLLIYIITFDLIQNKSNQSMQKIKNILNSIPLTCKVIYVVSFVLYVIGFIIPTVPQKIANYPHRIEQQKQYYRLFFTFFSKGYSILSIINIIIDFLWIKFFFTKLEKTYSTIFFAIQIFIQNFVLQIVFTIISVILIHFDILSDYVTSFGWSPLIIIFIFKKVHRNPTEQFKLICFSIPKKYLPYIVAVLGLIYAYAQFFCILIAISLGYIQFVILGTHFIRLPLNFYKILDNYVPNKIKSRDDYIRVRNVQNQLQDECMNCCAQRSNQLNDQKSDPTKKAKRQRKTSKLNKMSEVNIQPSPFNLNQEIQSNPSNVPQIETNEQLQKK